MWLGIDLGQARVGLALSDPSLAVAHPAGNIDVYGDAMQAIDEVVNIIEDESIERVIVGLPLLMDGSEGESAAKARRWAQELTKTINVLMMRGEYALSQAPDVTLMDERLTTVMAHHQLAQSQVGSRAHRPKVDQQSAVNILQAALDRHDD